MNDHGLWKDPDPEPTELEGLVERGPFDAAVELELPAVPAPPILVRPLVTEPEAAWVAPLRSVVPPDGGQRIGVVSADTPLAAKLAADAAVWFADRGRRTVVVDGCVVSPVLGKPLPEDGDEGLVDAALFGVSTSLAARRTLASGVSVMTAGSYPVSVEAVLGGDEIERVLGSFANDVLVLVVLPPDYVPTAAHALTGVIVAGASVADVRNAADRAGLAVAGTMAAAAVVVSLPGAREAAVEFTAQRPAGAPREAGAQSREAGEEFEEPPAGVVEEREPAEDEREPAPVEREPVPWEAEEEREPAEDEREPAPDEREPDAVEADVEPGTEAETEPEIGAPEPRSGPAPFGGTVPDDEGRFSAGKQPVPGEASGHEGPATEETGVPPRPEAAPVLMTASRTPRRRPRRRSRAGILIPILIIAAAVGWWLLSDGPLAPTGGKQPPQRTADVGTGAIETGTIVDAEEEPAEEAATGDAATTPDEAPGAGVTTATVDGERPDGAGATPAGERREQVAGTREQTDDDLGEEPISLVGSGGRYVVYMSSHSRAELAELEAERVERRGIPAEIVVAELEDGSIWHRLALPGGYPTLAAARLALDRLSELGYEGAWVEYRSDASREG